MFINIGDRIKYKVGTQLTESELHSLIGFSEKTFNTILKTLKTLGYIDDGEEEGKYTILDKVDLKYEINQNVEKILKNNPLLQFVKHIQNKHKKDTIVQTFALLSAISAWLKTDTLNIFVTGRTTSGKTHVLSSVLTTLPSSYYFQVTSKSDKAIYYAVKNGFITNNTIIMFDDINAYGNFLANLKTLAWTASIKPVHWTVAAQQFRHIDIKSNMAFWLTSVNPIKDEELQNRFIFVNVNDEDDEEINKFIIKKYTESIEEENSENDWIFQDAFTVLSYLINDKRIKIPFKFKIKMLNRRDIVKFFVTIKSVTAFNILQRQHDAQTVISNDEDVKTAEYLWSKINPLNLPNNIMKTYNAIPINGIDKYQLANKLGVSVRTVIRHVNFLSEKGLIKYKFKNKHTFYEKKRSEMHNLIETNAKNVKSEIVNYIEEVG